MTDVFVAGSLHWDVVVDAPRLPGLDETLIGHAVAYRFGGKGGNQAVAAARMGASVAMAGQIGRDDAGGRLRASLDASGVDHTQVVECDTPSGMSVAIVDERGDYGAVVVSGANATFVPENIILPRDLKVLLLQNEIPESVNLALARRLTEHTQVILNAAPARAMSADLLTCVDVLVANRVEAAELIGTETENLNPEVAARTLSSMGPGTVIVTLGAEGMVIADAAEAEQLDAFAVGAISSHGAGDVFCGALAAGVSKGAAVREACRFGAAAAALAVSTPFEARKDITKSVVRDFLG